MRINVLRTIMTAASVFCFFSAGFPAVPSVVIEAENYSGEGGGVSVLTKTPGRIESSGNKCIVAWNNKGHFVEWEADIPQDGEYKAVLRFANSRKWKTVRDLSIDGAYPSEAFKRILLLKTGGLSRDENNWHNQVVADASGKPALIRLTKGKHKIKMTNLGGETNADGQTNFDSIGFIDKDADPSVLGKPCVLPNGDYKITVNPKGKRYLEPVIENIAEKRNIVYRSEMNEKQALQQLKLDIFYPLKDSAKKRPAVLMIHGGGLRSGVKEEMEDLCVEYAKRGFVAVTVDYRTRAKPQDNFSAAVTDAVSDCIEAQKWIIREAAKYNIDTKKIFTGGESSGASLSLMMKHDNKYKVNPNRNGIVGVVYLYGGKTEVTLDEKSPLLIIHADTDSVAPYANSVDLAKQAEEKKMNFRFFTMKGGNHTYNNRYYGDVVSWTSRFMYDVLSQKK